MPRTIRISLAALVLLPLFGCASQPITKPDPRDPWERFNRSIYKFNDAFDRAIAKPVAKTYTRVTPHPVQTGVSNFFDNFNYPIVIVNDFLQAQFVPFFEDIGRFVMNTTVGIGGVFDPASKAGLAKNNRDFGQTLGKWGIHPGPFLEIPFLGPSDIRDGVGKLADTYSSPYPYIQNNYWSYGLYLFDKIDTRARLLSTDNLIQSAYDPYAFIRNAYLQRREFMVTGAGQSSEEEQQEEKMLEEAGEGTDQQAPPKKPETH